MRHKVPGAHELAFALIGTALGLIGYLSFPPGRVHGGGITAPAYGTIQNASVAVQQRNTLNFTGGGCVDNGAATPPRTDCTVASASPSTLFSQTNSATDNVQTTETTLVGTGTGSTAIPANTYAAGVIVKFEASGFYSTTAAPGSLRIQLKHAGGASGTVVLGDTGTITPISSVTNGTWRLWVDITCRTAGAGGTLIINTTLELIPSSLVTLTPADAPIANTATLTVDTTAAQTVNLTAIWSAAGQSITSTNLTFFLAGGATNGAFYGTVQNSGTPLTQRAILNFPTGVCADNSGATRTDCLNMFDVPWQITAPVNAQFANFNFNGGGAATSVTSASNYITLLQNGGDANGAISGRSKNVIAATYTLTVGLTSQYLPGDFNQWGIFVTDGTKVIAWGLQRLSYSVFGFNAGAGFHILISKFNTVGGSFNADYFNGSPYQQNTPVLWLRIKEDVTNRTYFLSNDGLNFMQVFQSTVTDFLTTTQYGFFCRNGINGAQTQNTIHSWNETNP